MPSTESRVKMNGLATALDTAADKCSQTIKRSVAAPSPEYRRTTSFCQNRICEKYLTVPYVKKEGFQKTRSELFGTPFGFL